MSTIFIFSVITLEAIYDTVMSINLKGPFFLTQLISNKMIEYKKKNPRKFPGKHFYQLALKLSGAVQASSWTAVPGELGYIYSFNGPHSLFADTIRTLRVLYLTD